MDGTKTNEVLTEVFEERARQTTKWGVQSHPNGTGPGFKPMADFARDECNDAFENAEGTWMNILMEEFYEALAEGDPAKLRVELLQTAAVAVAWVEDIDRRAAS